MQYIISLLLTLSAFPFAVLSVINGDSSAAMLSLVVGCIAGCYADIHNNKRGQKMRGYFEAVMILLIIITLCYAVFPG